LSKDLELICYTCPATRLNSYLIGNSDGIFIIDLPEISDEFYDLLIGFSENIQGILITHQNPTNLHSIKTIKKIFFEIEVFSSHEIPDQIWHPLRDGESIPFFHEKCSVYSVPSHHLDSLIFSFQNCLFTGDVLTAGTVTDSVGGINRAIILDFIKENLFVKNRSTRLYPSIGPISTVHGELETNLDLMIKDVNEFSDIL
jgi:hydroxyacylglutathione hydrolase